MTNERTASEPSPYLNKAIVLKQTKSLTRGHSTNTEFVHELGFRGQPRAFGKLFGHDLVS